MGTIRVVRAEPVKPPIKSIIIECSVEEATALRNSLGAHGVHWKGDTAEQAVSVYRFYSQLNAALSQ